MTTKPRQLRDGRTWLPMPCLRSARNDPHSDPSRHPQQEQAMTHPQDTTSEVVAPSPSSDAGEVVAAAIVGLVDKSGTTWDWNEYSASEKLAALQSAQAALSALDAAGYAVVSKADLQAWLDRPAHGWVAARERI